MQHTHSPANNNASYRAASVNSGSNDGSPSKSHRVYHESPARAHAKDRLEKSLKLQKREAQAMQAAIKDGSFKKTQIDPMGFAP